MLRGIEALIVVHHEGDIPPNHRAHRPNSRQVLLEIAIANLDLDGLETLFDRAADLGAVGGWIDDAIAIVGRQGLGLAAKEARDRPSDGMPKRVPHCHVQSCDRHADEPLPAEQAETAVERRITLNRHNRLAHDLFPDALEQPDEGPKSHGRVAKEV
jgi:hypothetical protein